MQTRTEGDAAQVPRQKRGFIERYLTCRRYAGRRCTTRSCS